MIAAVGSFPALLVEDDALRIGDVTDGDAAKSRLFEGVRPIANTAVERYLDKHVKDIRRDRS